MKKILIACTALALLAPATAFAQGAPAPAQAGKNTSAHKGHKRGGDCQCRDKERCECNEHGKKHKTAAEREAWKKEHKGEGKMRHHAMEHGKAGKEMPAAAPAN
ncbi:hypothetical protein [Candidatus Tokpelaia sp.]|uniref:hypothetical protein n=1 Tax=Candidatus Tokpelaia sp. TaxID=2233777 RepID=UPI0012393061|nr:hypothetical protein [Candidatus Tokpelaia sp.]KAA6405130.1 hypothetical protein DPQ22_06145 [Candidatus Tokpelaia sp.]